MIRSALTSALCYRDPKAALKFLEAAFDFELVMLIEDNEGNLAHAEMSFGDGLVMIGNEWTAQHRSPASIDGFNTQSVHIHLEGDIDAHCERARAAGAEILMEPADQFYGDRTYRCRDPEGHFWTIGAPVRAVSVEEAEAESGLKVVKGWA
ncbi:VOC family protein [Caulobacter sp. BE254]|uniref:VOC family protein n=1 Tax=Caulobacter sp. BE254 TaxID=2817720 RepID=UPI0028606E54|nr:VOC family protein [Caulobacter sp. BE254]MDR7118867.1 putative glyoxalase superfamily protein PhnB [Caulobacter sp. BE254]